MGRLRTGKNLIEKIVQRYTVDQPALQGDFISILPHRVMTHDNTAAVISKFSQIANSFKNNQQAVFTLDHGTDLVTVRSL
jgi:homoaconitate hydratase